MKTRRLAIFGLSFIALVAVLYVAPTSYSQLEQLLFKYAPEPTLTAETLSTVRFLTGDPDIGDGWASFSPDGKYVLFSRNVDHEKTWNLFVIPADGGEARRLTESPLPVTATRAVWSKQGNLIAFTGTDVNNKNSVWLINSDGTNPRELILDGLSDSIFYPSWYPDGEQLAVMDAKDEVIKRIDLKRGSVVTVTDHDQVLAGKPSVSPDGEWIAFAGQKNVGQRYNHTANTIWLARNDGVLQTLEPDFAIGRHPSWSPDGRWLAFDSARGPLTAVFIINRDGTGLRRITDYALSAREPVWSPDGTQLVVLAKYTVEPGPFGLAIVDLKK